MILSGHITASYSLISNTSSYSRSTMTGALKKLAEYAPDLKESHIPAAESDRAIRYHHDRIPPGNVFKAVDNFLDLSHRRGTHFLEFLTEGTQNEIEPFLEIITALLRRGIVGTEYLELNNRPYRTFLATRLTGSYSKLPVYNKPDIDQKI